MLGAAIGQVGDGGVRDSNRPVQFVAHRAGNDPQRSADAIAAADAIEIDVHLWHGRLEVRHAKRLWILQRLWEQWELLPTDTKVPSFDEALEALPPSVPVMVDLKGWSPRLVDRVRESIGESRSLIASARGWWLLPRFRDRPHTTTLRSIGTNWQLWLALRINSGGNGVVVHERLLGADITRRLVAKYTDVFTWNVHTAERAESLVGLGVRGLILDDPELARVLRTRLQE